MCFDHRRAIHSTHRPQALLSSRMPPRAWRAARAVPVPWWGVAERCIGGGLAWPSLRPSATIGRPVKTKRKIAKVPFKVLDAPALQDDFYLNLVIVAVACVALP